MKTGSSFDLSTTAEIEEDSCLDLKEWFNHLTLTELATITTYPKEQWCKWFRGNRIGEEVLNRASSQINEHLPSGRLSPGALLDLIQNRRKATAHLSAVGLNYTPKQYVRRKPQTL